VLVRLCFYEEHPDSNVNKDNSVLPGCYAASSVCMYVCMYVGVCVGVLVICVLVFTVFLYCFVYVYLFVFFTSVRNTANE
jgi:uncharacterized membrane protein